MTPATPPNWADILMAKMAVCSFVVTTLGLLGVIYQLWKLRAILWSDTHGKLCDQSLAILQFLAAKPVTYDYFYNNKILTDQEPEKHYILYSAEAIVNFMEHLVLQRGSLPTDQWDVWQKFIESTYEHSTVIQKFLEQHKNWYSKELLRIVAGCGIHPA